MGKIKKVQRCFHCGAILQCEDAKAKGYTSPEILNKRVPVQIIYCDKCYNDMIEMNSAVLEQNIDEQVLKILDDAVATDALILWVVDLFSFSGNLNSEIAKKIKNNKVCVIGTKRDLFGKLAKDEDLIEYLTKRFQKAGINPYNVSLINGADKINGKEVLTLMDFARKGHDVYMIGNLASGKTSIINKVMKSYVNKSKREIKTELYPGTEVKVLEVPLSRSASFYELPGISQTTSVVTKVEKEIAKMITPKKELHPHYRNLGAGEGVIIGSLAVFSIIKAKGSQQYCYYSSEPVEVKKLPNRSIEKAFVNNTITKLVRPVSSRYSTFSDYDLFDISMENDGKKHDICIEGLGWLSFVSKGQVIRVCLPRGCALTETLAKVK